MSELVRTVEDWDALPDNSILEVVEYKTDRTTNYEIGELLRLNAGWVSGPGWMCPPSETCADVVCRVVELGGEQ